MKKYNYKNFEHDDDLIEWLNENQHINVINISFIDRNMTNMTYYKVFYYTEEEERVDYQPNNDGYRSSLYRGTYGHGEYNSYE